jgi:uncharacterized protein
MWKKQPMAKQNFSKYQTDLASFSEHWKVAELALFGAALHDDFKPENAMGILVTFAGEARWSQFDLINMQNDLERMFNSKIELVERTALEHSQNAVRRKNILSETEVIFAA